MLSRLNRIRAEHWFAAGNGLAALAIGLAAFGLRAARTPWIEVPAALTMALLAASAVALARRAPWAPRLARVAGGALLAVGLAAVAVLGLGLAFRRGVGGPGAGPGLLLIAGALLALVPYAVIYPAALLLWLGAQDRPR